MLSVVQEPLFTDSTAPQTLVVRIHDLDLWKNPFISLHDAMSIIKAEIPSNTRVTLVVNEPNNSVALVEHLSSVFGWHLNTDEILRESAVYDHLLYLSGGVVQRAIQPTLF